MRSATNSFCAKETCLVSHRNAPLTPAGRLRLVQRCRYRPIAHVAAEAGVSRQCLSKWVNRYRHHGESGLVDRSSAAHRHPTQLEAEIIAEIAQLRRDKKWSARLIAVELADRGHRVSTAINRADHFLSRRSRSISATTIGSSSVGRRNGADE